MGMFNVDIKTILEFEQKRLQEDGYNFDITEISGIFQLFCSAFGGALYDEASENPFAGMRDEWNAIDERYRKFFMTAFPLHYFNDEIGLETLTLFKIALAAKLYENGDFINSILENLDKNVLTSYSVRKLVNDNTKASTVIKDDTTERDIAVTGSSTDRENSAQNQALSKSDHVIFSERHDDMTEEDRRDLRTEQLETHDAFSKRNRISETKTGTDSLNYGKTSETNNTYGKTNTATTQYGKVDTTETDYGKTETATTTYGKETDGSTIHGETITEDMDYGKTTNSTTTYGQIITRDNEHTGDNSDTTVLDGDKTITGKTKDVTQGKVTTTDIVDNNGSVVTSDTPQGSLQNIRSGTVEKGAGIAAGVGGGMTFNYMSGASLADSTTVNKQEVVQDTNNKPTVSHEYENYHEYTDDDTTHTVNIDEEDHGTESHSGSDGFTETIGGDDAKTITHGGRDTTNETLSGQDTTSNILSGTDTVTDTLSGTDAVTNVEGGNDKSIVGNRGTDTTTYNTTTVTDYSYTETVIDPTTGQPYDLEIPYREDRSIGNSNIIDDKINSEGGTSGTSSSQTTDTTNQTVDTTLTRGLSKTHDTTTSDDVSGHSTENGTQNELLQADENNSIITLEMLMKAEPLMNRIWNVFDDIFMQIIDVFP